MTEATWRIITGDCLEAMRGLPDASVDAVVTDPPYGLEFMGKAWDSFRVDDPGTARHRGERAGDHGELAERDGATLGGRLRVGYGGTGRPRTHRCRLCGKRDQFRNRHEPCGEGEWKAELIDPHAAPPTMLAFQEWVRAWALEALRVLKPGGHLLAFGGTRTYHRLTCGLEDAGFEIRDCLAWLYGSGFPKSLDVSKAIDKAAGAEREVVPGGGRSNVGTGARSRSPGTFSQVFTDPTNDRTVRNDLTLPATPEAQAWDGWGTALKPAHEPIVLARKPLAGTVAGNVLTHGTGALNVDGCRIGTAGGTTKGNPPKEASRGVYGDGLNGACEIIDIGSGRWPANVLLGHAEGCEQIGTQRVKPGYGDEDGLETVEAWNCEPGCPVRLLDQQSGETQSSDALHPGRVIDDRDARFFGQKVSSARTTGYVDSGGASRFFYVAKADRAERELGKPWGATERELRWSSGDESPGTFQSEGTNRRAWNHHPTVKPIALMAWLCRLVTPPGGTVLDPFTGSGTTGIAALREGFSFLGIEREPEYVEIARNRIIGDAPLLNAAAEALEPATP